jgi:hypothetical protein
MINLIQNMCHLIGLTVTAAHITAADGTIEVQGSTLEVVLHVLTNSIVVQNLFFV